MTPFQIAMQALNDSPKAGKPLAIAKAREAALKDALLAMGHELGVELKPASIDALGEIPVLAVAKDIATRSRGACGQYGEDFAAWLNHIPVRTGTVSTQGHVTSQQGWCWANHFDVERLVRLYADELAEGAA